MGLALGSHSAATNRPRDQEQVTPPHELQFGNGDTPPNLLCGWEVQMGRPGDRLVSLPDQPRFRFVKGSCYHHQPLLWGNLRLVTGLSVWLSPFTSLSVPIHLTQNFHHNASRASGVAGGGGGCGHASPTTGGPGPLAFLLSPSPTCPLPSRARVGCYLVTLLQEDVLSRNEPLVPRNDEIAGCAVFVLQGPDDKHF